MKNETQTIRQPIVTVAGHVDHGKTTLLDSIRGTCVAAKEAGAITQKISFTLVPSEHIEKKCSKLLGKYKIGVEMPGFLFVDTPGHAAFTNLRKLGGNIADLAVLVIDINEGIMEQTKETIELLKANKVPFIVALNKVDRISGWKHLNDDQHINIESQAAHTKKDYDKKFFNIMTSLSMFGFNSDVFYRISDFTKQLTLVPCSGKTAEGLPELIVMLTGLAQKFLKGKLSLGKEAKGTILEIKKEKGFTAIEAILYDGFLEKGDGILIAGLDKVIKTKIRAIFEVMPFSKEFKTVEKVHAASGIRLQLPVAGTEDIVPGMFFTNKVSEKAKQELEHEISNIIKVEKEGIIAKAESIGSLQALIGLLKKSGISVSKAGVGNITKQDIISAVANLETRPLDSVVVGFNSDIEQGVEDERIKIIKSDVIYHIIEQLEKWRADKALELERANIASLTWPCKIKIMRNCCFRQSKPAIFGVKIEAGILKPETVLMNEKGEEIEKVKGIQHEGKNIEKATQGQEVAISLPNITFGRQIKEDEHLYSLLNEEEFRELKQNKKYLSPQEIALLQEIAQIKRKTKPTWGV